LVAEFFDDWQKVMKRTDGIERRISRIAQEAAGRG
jgi:hypothetical protein